MLFAVHEILEEQAQGSDGHDRAVLRPVEAGGIVLVALLALALLVGIVAAQVHPCVRAFRLTLPDAEKSAEFVNHNVSYDSVFIKFYSTAREFFLKNMVKSAQITRKAPTLQAFMQFSC